MISTLRIIFGIYLMFVAIVPCHCHKFSQRIDGAARMCVAEKHTCDSKCPRDFCTPFCSCTSNHSVNYFQEKEVAQTFEEPEPQKHIVYLLRKEESFPPTLHLPPEA